MIQRWTTLKKYTSPFFASVTQPNYYWFINDSANRVPYVLVLSDGRRRAATTTTTTRRIIRRGEQSREMWIGAVPGRISRTAHGPVPTWHTTTTASGGR